MSVVIASFNHGRFLRENLDSILAQTYEDFEIVVVDDGSADNSLDILLDYQERVPKKIRVFTHPAHTNCGMYHTFNRAIAEARGELIAIQGSDDVWLPEKLARQVAILDADAAVGAVFSQIYIIDEAGNVLGISGGPAGQELLQALLLRNVVPSQSLIYRRSLYPTNDHFTEDTLVADWEMHVRLATSTQMAYIPEPLVKYRRHGRNVTDFDLLIAQNAAPDLMVVRRVLTLPGLRQRRDYLHLTRLAFRGAASGPLNLAIHAYHRGDGRVALAYFWSTVKIYPRILIEQPLTLLMPLKIALGHRWVSRIGRCARMFALRSNRGKAGKEEYKR